jgi:hypothetical protein
LLGNRLAHLDQLFERMAQRTRWDDGRKIKWLQQQAVKMGVDPL